jgi:predicted Zn finger-like uncharacterized protein
MRLICPNCGAQYEVDDKVIPETGRDVQCSNCGHTWFQRPAHLDADLAEELGQELPAAEESDADAPAAAKPRRSLDPETANVLREEAAREAEARRAEASGMETQPDLGLDDTAEDTAAKSAAARARMARLRGLEADDTDAGLDRSRRERLPDIDEINSTLRASPEDDLSAPGAKASVESQAKPRRRGFRLGFSLAVLVVAGGALVYRFAPQIVDSVPQAEPYLTAYVDWANATRVQVNGLVETAAAWINVKIANLTGDAS